MSPERKQKNGPTVREISTPPTACLCSYLRLLLLPFLGLRHLLPSYFRRAGAVGGDRLRLSLRARSRRAKVYSLRVQTFIYIGLVKFRFSEMGNHPTLSQILP